MTELPLRTLHLPDGRSLAYAVWGDPAGEPVLALHGTPGCRLGRHPDDAAVAAAGLRVVTYDRPGYGRSDRHRGRRVVDCVADVAAIADDLGLDRFCVTGGSGGGPHALAVAARLPDRVRRAACVVGVAPFDAPGLDWFAGMDPANVEEFGWAVEGEAALERELPAQAEQQVAEVAGDPSQFLSGFDLSPADRAVLADPGLQAVLREAVPEQFAGGVSGWVDDDLAFVRDWGFSVDEVAVPVRVRYGAHDVLVPAAHGRWLAEHVPGAVVQVDQEGGHLSSPDAALQDLRETVFGGWA